MTCRKKQPLNHEERESMTLDTSIVRSASTFGPMQTDWETRIDMDRLRTQRLRKTR
jgi:hypothetical protein